jgi:hypothetical protein
VDVSTQQLPVYLLGAGASKDAGLPLANGITQQALEHLNDGKSDTPQLAPLFNYVVSAISAHAGKSGQRPDELPGIETVVAAIDLLTERESLEIAPFVGAWDPAVGMLGRKPRTLTSTDLRELEKALSRTGGFRERTVEKVIAKVVDARISADNSAAYGQLKAQLACDLLNTLRLSSDESVRYLTPLCELGRTAGPLTVATLNYDVTVETAGRLTNVHVDTGVEHWAKSGALEFASSGVHLLKLHGSIDWRFPSQHGVGKSPGDGFEPEALVSRWDHQPAVIYGAREKLQPEGPFLDLRGEFEARLQNSECLVCIGYSFGDDHVNIVLRRWLERDPARWMVIADPKSPRERRGFYDGSFVSELWRLNTQRKEDLNGRPRVYPLAHTAADCLQTVSQMASTLRESFQSWEEQWGSANSGPDITIPPP